MDGGRGKVCAALLGVDGLAGLLREMDRDSAAEDAEGIALLYRDEGQAGLAEASQGGT